MSEGDGGGATEPKKKLKNENTRSLSTYKIVAVQFISFHFVIYKNLPMKLFIKYLKEIKCKKNLKRKTL